MKTTTNLMQANRFAPMRPARRAAIGCAVLLGTSMAHAQIAKVNSVLTNIQTILVGASLLIVTIAIIWAGFKMVFQHAKWSEVSNIVIGAIFIGGAGGIANWLIN